MNDDAIPTFVINKLLERFIEGSLQKSELTMRERGNGPEFSQVF